MTVEVYLPASSHTRLKGLCKTRWVERHTCLDVFLEIYEALITFLDAILSPHEYPDLPCTTGSWDWDSDTRVKAQGLKAALSSFQIITVFMITKNTLDLVKLLTVKFQKRDQDIFEAYRMVDEVIESVKTTRKNIDTTFSLWYDEILQLTTNIGVEETVPRKTSLQRNRINTPSACPMEHYRRTIAIPLLDSLIIQMEERFKGEERHAGALLFLVPSVMLTCAQISGWAPLG